MPKLVRPDHPALNKKCKNCDQPLELDQDLTTRPLTDEERDQFGAARDTAYQIAPGGFVIHVGCQ